MSLPGPRADPNPWQLRQLREPGRWLRQRRLWSVPQRVGPPPPRRKTQGPLASRGLRTEHSWRGSPPHEASRSGRDPRMHPRALAGSGRFAGRRGNDRPRSLQGRESRNPGPLYRKSCRSRPEVLPSRTSDGPWPSARALMTGLRIFARERTLAQPTWRDTAVLRIELQRETHGVRCPPLVEKCRVASELSPLELNFLRDPEAQ